MKKNSYFLVLLAAISGCQASPQNFSLSTPSSVFSTTMPHETPMEEKSRRTQYGVIIQQQIITPFQSSFHRPVPLQYDSLQDASLLRKLSEIKPTPDDLQGVTSLKDLLQKYDIAYIDASVQTPEEVAALSIDRFDQFYFEQQQIVDKDRALLDVLTSYLYVRSSLVKSKKIRNSVSCLLIHGKALVLIQIPVNE